MLTDEIKDEIRDFYTRVSESLPGFKPRLGQRQMVGAIANTLDRSREDKDEPANGQNLIAIEGRTGVGKTVGYLVPALLMAKKLGKKLVISTGTVALQEQLYNRDLPAVVRCMDKPVSYALAKGRGRFVCPSRLAEFSGGGQMGLIEEDSAEVAVWDHKPEKAELELMERLGDDFLTGQWDGDRDALDKPVPQPLWARISTDSSGCAGKRCSMYRDCPYFKKREEMDGVDVIVANHDLVLSCLASNSPLLPSPLGSIYVFDEAHHLPGIAISRFAQSAPIRSLAKWFERLPKQSARALSHLPAEHRPEDITPECESLGRKLTELAAALERSDAFDERTTLRFANGRLDEDLQAAAEEITGYTKSLGKVLAGSSATLNKMLDEGDVEGPAVEHQAQELSADLTQLENLDRTWRMMLEPAQEGVPPLAKWILKTDSDFIVNASPITAADVLDQYLWSTAGAVVLTSATLTTLGDFDYYRKNTGLLRYANTTTMAVASPFDYPNQGVIHVPRLTSDPREPDAHTAEIAERLPELTQDTTGGTLVLFASRRQMRGVLEALPVDMREAILVQGDQGRESLLMEHAARVAKDQPSIIFGLASMGEGLDLPGRLCEHVVIAKVPFAPPDSPIGEAMSEWIDQNNGNPFMELTLPAAGLTLIQWCGRLIRSEDDRGRVTILDPRLNTRRYGKQLIAGLPPFRRQ